MSQTPAQAMTKLEAAALALANAVNEHLHHLPRPVAMTLGAKAIDVFAAVVGHLPAAQGVEAVQDAINERASATVHAFRPALPTLRVVK